jgi:hypothetical protein
VGGIEQAECEQSRTFDHDTHVRRHQALGGGEARSTAISAAASASGMNPIRNRVWLAVIKQLRGRDYHRATSAIFCSRSSSCAAA